MTQNRKSIIDMAQGAIKERVKKCGRMEVMDVPEA